LFNFKIIKFLKMEIVPFTSLEEALK
jgi:hypothetical protein